MIARLFRRFGGGRSPEAIAKALGGEVSPRRSAHADAAIRGSFASARLPA